MQFALLLCMFPMAFVSGKDFPLVVTQSYAYPNCVGRTVVLVNGYEPNQHPPIVIETAEQFTFSVSNQLHGTALTMHFHGIDQIGTPWADGTAFVNDCPLRPGSNQTMAFTAPAEPGTFFWHGHLGLDNAMGMQGLIYVVPKRGEQLPSAQQHDADIPLLLNEWYSGAAIDHETGLHMPNESFVFPGAPESPLINGLGKIDCNEAKDKGLNLIGGNVSSCKECVEKSLYNKTVDANKVYMLRIVNGAMLMGMNVIVEGHVMTVVEIDGQAIKPTNVTSLDIHTGQRVGVLITTDQEPRTYWISISYRLRNVTKYAEAVLYYNHSAGKPNEANLVDLQGLHPAWWDTEFWLAQQRSFEATDNDLRFYPEEESVDRQFVFLGTQEYFTKGESRHIPMSDASTTSLRLGMGEEQPWGFCQKKDGEDNFLRWAVGRVTWKPPKQPVLQALYHNTDFENQLNENMGFYKVELGKTYEVVLQNYPACNGVCEAHPWHLHGMKFWHVGTWEGVFNGTVPTEGGGQHYKRDTILVVGQNTSNSMTPFGKASNRTKPCGYTVIRFTVDNRGAWPFHCHIEWHFGIGMFTVFYTDPEQGFPDPPKSYYNDNHVCGTVPVVDQAIIKICGGGWQSVKSPECWGQITVMSLLMMCALCVPFAIIAPFSKKLLLRMRTGEESIESTEDMQRNQEHQDV